MTDCADLLMQVSPSQREIVRLVAEGCSNKEIAERMGVSCQTVKNQLTVIYQRVGVRSRVQLALFAARQGVAA